MRYPTVPDDAMPSNMIAFSVPLHAGAGSEQAFWYDTKERALYTDIKGHDDQGLPSQLDNVRIDANTPHPELQTLWNLTSAYRIMHDTEYLKSINGANPPVEAFDGGDARMERQGLAETTPLPQGVAVGAPTSPPPPAASPDGPRMDSPVGVPVGVPTDQFVGELYTKDQVVAETQRENDRMVIETLWQAFVQYVDGKEKIVPILEAMVQSNQSMYDRHFGEDFDDDIQR